MIENLNEDEFSDLFGSSTVVAEKQKTAFSNEELESDMFNSPLKKDETYDILKEKDEQKDEQVEDVDILGTEKKEQKSETVEDINSFFQKKIKDGYFSALVDDEGKDIVLEKPEDYDAFIEANINYKIEQKEQELENTWYKSKNPVWQMVAKYSEVIEDPSELIPYLTGIQNIINVSEIDETTIDGAEQIVRYQKAKTGTPQDVIDEEIDALKQTDKLVSAASKVKPVIIQQEQQSLVEMEKEKKQQEENYIKTVYEYQNKTVEVLEKPLFGQKLKQDEKALVYDLIGAPNQELGGYPIFSVIDNLYQKGDFETLTQIALLVGKRDSFFKYARNSTEQKVAENLQRNLRIQSESGIKSSGNNDPEVKINKIPSSYANNGGKARFGQ
jgi:hypothetical protein